VLGHGNRKRQLSQAGTSNRAAEDLHLLSFLKLCEEKVKRVILRVSLSDSDKSFLPFSSC